MIGHGLTVRGQNRDINSLSSTVIHIWIVVIEPKIVILGIQREGRVFVRTPPPPNSPLLSTGVYSIPAIVITVNICSTANTSSSTIVNKTNTAPILPAKKAIYL